MYAPPSSDLTQACLTPPQMAIAWVLRVLGFHRCPKCYSVERFLRCGEDLEFSPRELKKIDRFATEGGIDLWRKSFRIVKTQGANVGNGAAFGRTYRGGPPFLRDVSGPCPGSIDWSY